MLKIEEPEIALDFKHSSQKTRVEYIEIKGITFRLDSINHIQKDKIISFSAVGSAHGSNFSGNNIIICDYINKQDQYYLDTLLW